MLLPACASLSPLSVVFVPLPSHCFPRSIFTLAPALMPNRYSGLHVLSLSSSAVGGNSSAVLQLLDSSHIHGDGALVRA